MTTEVTAVDQETAFAEAADNEYEDDLRRNQIPRDALLPVLWLAQREFGSLSVEVMEYVAERLDLPPTKVLQVATFYTMFKKRPSGKYHVEVCTCVPCCMNGGVELVRTLEEKLGVRAGETSADRRFSLAEAECLAACGNAPVMQIGRASW